MVAYSSKIKRVNKNRSVFGGGHLFILIIIVFCGLFVFLNVRVFKKFLFLKEKREKLTQQISKLEKERDSLLKKISALQNEEFLEKVARDDLNLKKKGERVVAFSFEGESVSSSEDLSQANQIREYQKETRLSTWQKILKWLRLK